ncbi:uncharacterized protein LOC106474903 [Limulus polyphemus]|uniref:Uncharacterized protein LOC106474903 n=1 Tax=Limulus polyphemus TaxID=6850 RepID=A0ABM1BYF3_LIMPO|nr:uncharacterized protein LOC106474903 [Limulus polyphemus]
MPRNESKPEVPETEDQSKAAYNGSFEVHEEEIVIVVLVLVVWVAVILLFFNKWGKIRMLEPYQPEYRSPPYNSTIPKPPRMNMPETLTSSFFERELPWMSSMPGYSTQRSRPRQNSVFVGNQYNRSSLFVEQGIPRKVKSAEDIKSLVVQISDQRLRTTVL